MSSKFVISGLTTSRTFYTTSRLRNFQFPPSKPSSSGKQGLRLSVNLREPVSPNNIVSGSNDNIRNVEPRFIKQFNEQSIYDPFDFSMARINLDKKFPNPGKPLNKMNAKDLYLYPEILARYVSSTGRILHSDVTGLSPRDQRLISKAIRRCQAIGLMSKVSNNYNK